MKVVKDANMKLMIRAGELRSPQWYRKAIKALFTCLTEDDHTDCKHHGKDYITTDPRFLVT